MSKYTVFITYGVTVETDEYNQDLITAKAVEKMFSHGENEVFGSCDAEIEEYED